jgi:hypothetical protein
MINQSKAIIFRSTQNEYIFIMYRLEPNFTLFKGCTSSEVECSDQFAAAGGHALSIIYWVGGQGQTRVSDFKTSFVWHTLHETSKSIYQVGTPRVLVTTGWDKIISDNLDTEREREKSLPSCHTSLISSSWQCCKLM